MTSETTPESTPDIDLVGLASRLILAMMASASTDDIRPIDWWPRAKSALETAASTADGWSHFISRMASKLQIDALNNHSAREASAIGAVMADHFAEFRALCERDAVYLVALAQVERDAIKGGGAS